MGAMAVEVADATSFRSTPGGTPVPSGPAKPVEDDPADLFCEIEWIICAEWCAEMAGDSYPLWELCLDWVCWPDYEKCIDEHGST
jgi:hypothetical protein